MPSVIFDCVGTLFSYENGAVALEKRLGAKLAKLGIPSKVVFVLWLCSTERDYGYLSQIRLYKTFFDIMKHTFGRVLFQAGVPDPMNFYTQEDIEYIMSEYRKLKARPEMPRMMEILRENDFEVWACSDASPDRIKGYFDGSGVEMPMDHILSADMCQAGKPEAAVYKMARDAAEKSRPGETHVFAAAHSWDVRAAKESGGLQTAYCTVYELDPCVPIFGEYDIIEDDLVAMANAIVAKYGSKK